MRYLAPLYERYLDKLTEAQQAALTEDFEALLNEDLYRLAPENAADKIKAVQKLPRKAQAIAYRLAEWRELYAINHNKPKRWVLSDDALVAIAKRPPKAREALYKVPNIKASSVKISVMNGLRLSTTFLPTLTPGPKRPINRLRPRHRKIFSSTSVLLYCNKWLRTTTSTHRISPEKPIYSA